MNYKIINSGSDGNATVIEDIILLDCGLPYKLIEKYILKIKLVLLTHIHSDHFNARTISRIALTCKNIRFGCGEWLVKHLIRCGVSRDRIDILEPNHWYSYSYFRIGTFILFHDVDNQGYKIEINKHKYIYATDTNKLQTDAKDYDVFLIEANYEEEELAKELKESMQKEEFNYKVRVPRTHLSKEKCLDFFFKNANNKSILEFMHVHKDR